MPPSLVTRLFVLAFAISVFALPFAACSNQGEGERCDRNSDNSGNDDCQDGLVCTHKEDLGGAAQTDICCPSDRSQATTSVCQLHVVENADSAPPAEASTSDAPSDSAGDSSDSASDAPSDSPSDSPSDAPGEGG